MTSKEDDSAPYQNLIKGVSLLLVIIGAIGSTWTVNGQLIGGALGNSILIASPTTLMMVFVVLTAIGLIGIGYSERI